MRRGLFAVALAAALAVGLSTSATADTAADTAILAGTCAGCHGAELGGSGAIPTLRGHSADYIRFTLTAFKDGERQATVMNRLAAGYSETEIEALAVYLSQLQ
ncbi:c-type cytochrome [Algihabitans albus]|uniref:c-type cytochrome n=1 Tax=Algihabitans albus TaxID=2164067 RepID=UPI000E5C6E47|nr:c-type cytochrome [Algihabitans albus]